MTSVILVNAERSALPTLVAATGDRAKVRFLEFFAANIRNPRTRQDCAGQGQNLEGISTTPYILDSEGERRWPQRRARRP